MSESIWMVERVYKDGIWRFVGPIMYSKGQALNWIDGIKEKYKPSFRVFKWDRASREFDTGSDA